MHIILAGQPALAQKLASPRLAQLRQRVSIVQGLAPLSHGEVKNYVEHRLRIAGYRGNPIFTDEAYESIAVATEGIPRNVNNFCFNALSLACGLRKRTVDSDIVNEVMSDLDIQRLTSGSPPETLESPYSRPLDVAHSPVEAESQKEISNAAEAAAYMQQVTLKLRSWRESLDKTHSGVRRVSGTSSTRDQDR
jgi:hypothetical protein